MLLRFVQYLTIITCGAYAYRKVLNLKKLSKARLTILTVSLFLISLLTAFLKPLISVLVIPVFLMLSISLFMITFKTDISKTVSAAIVALAISYSTLTISIVFCAAIFAISKIDFFTYSDIFNPFPSFIQVILVLCLFKMKRLKKGMPFLLNDNVTDIGVFLSTLLLCAVIAFGENDFRLVYIIPLVLILLFAVLVYLWWRSRIRRKYTETLRINEIKALKDKIIRQTDQISILRQQNEALSKIIHKDNKLIPAMELAVRSLFLKLESSDNADELKATGKNLLLELEKLCQERKGIIKDYEDKNKKINLTNIVSLDSTLNYMLQRASEKGINFETTVSGDTKDLIDKFIDEADLNTILADIIENALIACAYTMYKNVFVNIGVVNNCHCVGVFDSGIEFDINIFSKLGISRVTTHADSGGSGIGMQTLFDIAGKSKASIVIEEFVCNSGLYAKSITVVFDGLSRYVIKSYRADEIERLNHREDMTVMPLNRSFTA